MCGENIDNPKGENNDTIILSPDTVFLAVFRFVIHHRKEINGRSTADDG